MGASKLITPEEAQTLLSINECAKSGKTATEIAAQFGLKYSTARTLIFRAERYVKAVELLKTEPTDIGALTHVGRLPRLGFAWRIQYDYGVTTLKQLHGEWSRAELLEFPGTGNVAVDHIERVMSEMGLALALDSDQPKRREKVSHDTKVSSEPDKWDDREHVIEQCKRVRHWLKRAYDILADDLDDEETFGRIRSLLMAVPAYVNPMADAIRALNEKASIDRKAARALEAALERRREINHEIASAVATISAGKVIQFPRLRA